MSINSAYFKSKKGMSLLELLCAVLIMAIAVSCTASALAISHTSIQKGSAQDKASAKAQEYCDIIMAYVENIPSNEPEEIGADASKNKLFASSATTSDYRLDDAVINNLRLDIPDITQCNTKADATSKTGVSGKPFFTVEKSGEYTANGKKFISYNVSAYVYYGDKGEHSYCEGVISKPALAA